MIKKIIHTFNVFCISGIASVAVAHNWLNIEPVTPDALTREALFAKVNQTLLPTQKLGPFAYHLLMNIDVKPKTMQKSLPGEGEDYLALSNATLLANVSPVSWLHGRLVVSYFHNNKGQGDPRNQTRGILDEGTLTIADLEQTPFFFQAGRMYLPFGRYNRWVIAPTLVQMLTMSRAQALHAGFVDWYGLSLSAYLSQGFVTQNARKIQGDLNSGIGLYFDRHFQDVYRVHAGLQYMYNMLQTNALAQGGAFLANPALGGRLNVYRDRTDGLALQAGFGAYFVDVFFNYVTALNRTRDINLFRVNPAVPATAVGAAKPRAWELGFVVHLMICEKKTDFDFTFGRTFDTGGLYVFNNLPVNAHPFPGSRYILGATVHINEHAYVRLQWGHNNLYKAPIDNGTQGDDATIRLGMKL